MHTPDFWHRPNALASALVPLSLVYCLGAWLDRVFTLPQRAPIPVISVGNVVAGGAGKTPATIALAALLQQMGETPHILTRGYGGSVTTPQRVAVASDWRNVGDEALLLAHAAPTWVGRDRVAAARQAAQQGASCVVVDDAHQHHPLRKDIALLVIDGAYGLGNGLALPAGPLRESLTSALKRCDGVILTGTDAYDLRTKITAPIFDATLVPTYDAAYLNQGKWFAFAGLARPQKFFDGLTGLGVNLAATQAFADHHPYSTNDLDRLAARAKSLHARLITTAKDAVKIPAEQRAAIAVLDVTHRFADPQKIMEFLRTRLAQARA